MEVLSVVEMVSVKYFVTVFVKGLLSSIFFLFGLVGEKIIIINNFKK